MAYETSVHVRIGRAEKELLAVKAKAKKTTSGDLGRTFIQQGLAGFDPKHDDLLRAIEMLAAELDQVRKLAAGALAAAAMLKQHDESTPEGAGRAARKHIRNTLDLGSWIIQNLQSGATSEGG